MLLRPTTQSGFLINIEGTPTIWTTFSGISDDRETATYANGTGNRINKVLGPSTTEDVTCSAPYDPEVALEIEQLYRNYSCEYITITVQPTTCDGDTARGRPYILEGCLLKSLNVAEVDRESGSVSTIELGFTVNDWRR